MSFKLTHYCDNPTCKRLMPPEELAANRIEVQRLCVEGAYTERAAQQTFDEIFCAECLPQGAGYWEARRAIFKDALQVLERRLGNHAKQFWSARQNQTKLKAVGAEK